MAKVGKGLKGFGASKGSQFRIWEGGEHLLELGEVTAVTKMKDGNEVGVNVRVPFVILGGPVQPDGTDPKGKKGSIFINVDYDLGFTVDNLKDLFIAADVDAPGDVPPYAKLEGRKAAVLFSVRHSEKDGKDYQGARFIAPSKSKLLHGKASTSRSRSKTDDD